MSESKKIKILWWSDFIRQTGFGNVAEAIVTRLLKTGKYTIEVLGINYTGEPYNIPGHRYFHLRDVPVYPALTQDARTGQADFLGRQKFLNLLSKNDYDLAFVIQDLFNLKELKDTITKAKADKNFKYVLYFPVDGGVHKEWVESSVKVADYPVAYTQYGKREVLKEDSSLSDKVRVIFHGADTEIFHPFTDNADRKEFRKNFFHLEDVHSDNIFVITNVNRNQTRKDLVRSIDAFVKYLELNPNAILYLHTHVSDFAGVNLASYIQKYVPPEIASSRIVFPNQEVMKDGFPVEMMQKIYASSDVVISTTVGEGMGLSSLEAMSCGVPIIMPRNTSFEEIIGDNAERGYFVKSGEGSNYYVQRLDNDLKRPLVDVDSLVQTLHYVQTHPDKAKAKAAVALEWIKSEANWDRIAEQWDALLQEAYALKCKEDTERELSKVPEEPIL